VVREHVGDARRNRVELGLELVEVKSCFLSERSSFRMFARILLPSLSK